MKSKSFKQYWIENYGYITVGDAGEIFNNKGKELNHRIDEDGYHYIRVHFKNYRELMSNGKKYMVQEDVHRLVAKCFIENPNNLPEVNHKDGKKNNNSAKNLEWCTRKYNVAHYHAIGLAPSRKGSNNGRSKLTENDVPIIFRMIEQGYSIAEIARHFNVGWSTIQHVVKKETWSN